MAGKQKEVMDEMLRRIEETNTVRYQIPRTRLECSVTQEGNAWSVCAYDPYSTTRRVIMYLCNPAVTSADQVARRVEDDFRRNPEAFEAMVRGEF